MKILTGSENFYGGRKKMFQLMVLRAKNRNARDR